MAEDFLSEIIRRRAEKNPAFPALVAAAVARRELLLALAKERESTGLTQTEVAAAMGTSQSQIARLESANVDTKLSTVEKFAAVLGKRISGASSTQPEKVISLPPAPTAVPPPVRDA